MGDIDFHIHSIYSGDSILSPKTIIKLARKRGLSGIAVTDHDTILGGLKTMSNNLLVVVGAEIKTDCGEVTGLFLNEEIHSRRFVEVVDEIRDQGGVILLPHPYKNKTCNPKTIVEYVDLVEGLNARTPKELNAKARILADQYKLPIIAGSDAHTSFEIGRVRTSFQNSSEDLEDVRKSLLKGDVGIKGTESPMYVQISSGAVGRYKKSGFSGLIGAGFRKILRRV